MVFEGQTKWGSARKGSAQKRLFKNGSVQQLVFTLIGFTGLYTIAIVFFYYDWLFSLPFEVNPFVYEVCLNGSLCGGAAFTILLLNKAKEPFAEELSETSSALNAFKKRARILVVLGACCYLLSFAQLISATVLLSANMIYTTGIFAGLGAGILVPLWFERTRYLVKNGTAYIFGFMSIISVLAVFAVNAVDLVGQVVLCAVLLAVSFVLWFVLGNTRNTSLEQRGDENATEKSPLRKRAADESLARDSDTAPKGKSYHLILAPAIYMFLLSVMYGMLDTVAMASPTIPASSSGFSSLVGGLAADVIFLLYVRYDGKRYSSMLNGALALIATGLLFLPFLPDYYSVFLTILTHMAWEISLLVLFTLVVETYRTRVFTLTIAAAVVFALPRPGVVVGSGIASLIAVNDQYTFIQMTIVAFALLYLVFMGVVLLRTREKRAADRALRRKDELIRRYAQARDELYELACDEIAEEYQLTERETELLKLLAQGRDAGYIERALFLSRNTVKSYTKSIYTKLDVHSKQDLIDYVKASLPLE